MLLGYRIPHDWVYTVSGGALLTPDAELLHCGAPSERTRLSWAPGAQTTSSTVIITATRAQAFVPRVGYILGCSLPEGMRLEIRGLRAGDVSTYPLGGNSLTQRTILMPDGRTTGAWWVFDDALDPIIGYIVTLYNDVAGSTAIAAEDAFDIGEMNVTRAVDIPHELRWAEGRTAAASRRARTLSGASASAPQKSWRTLKLRPVQRPIAIARGGGLAGGTDWQRVAADIALDSLCAVIPRWKDIDDGQRTGILGEMADWPDVENAPGDRYQLGQMRVEEIPA